MSEALNNTEQNNKQRKDAYSLVAFALEHPELPEIVCAVSENYLLVYDRGVTASIDDFFNIDYGESVDIILSNLQKYYSGVTFVTDSDKVLKCLEEKCLAKRGSDFYRQENNATVFTPNHSRQYRIYALKASPSLDYVAE